MITVEAVLCLIPFMLMIMGIISLVNVFIVHNKIQYALYGAGSELSSYTYLYEVLGLHSADLKLNEDIDSNTEPVDTAITQITDFMEALSKLEEDVDAVGTADGDVLAETIKGIYEDGNTVYNSTKDILETGRRFAKEPKSLIRGIVYLGIEKADDAAKNLLLRIMVSGLVEKYLAGENGGLSADEYLKGYDVKGGMEGLDFSGSTLFEDAGKMINIVVEYDVELYFFGLFMKDNSVHVVQRVEIPAWLNGDGTEYKAE